MKQRYLENLINKERWYNVWIMKLKFNLKII
jgi:hypothetical protein